MTQKVWLSDFKVFMELWKEYVDIDFGHDVPEKNYKGFRTFVEDKLQLTVTGRGPDGLILNFESDEEYVMFKLTYDYA